MLELRQFGVAGAFLFLATHAEATEEFAYFESKVRPILVEHCYECHSEESGKRKGGLWLDRKEGWMAGGDSGPSIIPGNPKESVLIDSVSYHNEDLQMPPKNRLSEEEIAALKDWVSRGAHDPRDAALAGAVRREAIDYEKAKENWAYRPLQKSIPPEVSDKAWPRSEIDRFILSSLEEKKLEPATDADPAQLLRRLYYDLTGLPPTRAELQAFLKNPGTDAYEAIVDNLLSRIDFAENWGRHWLDVARYADSNGGDRNFTFYQAWRYRNYVIDAFNQDKSYYQFVKEQIAGDLLSYDTSQQRHDQLVGSTFLALGPKMLTERDKEKLYLDTADEQIDTVGRAFLGLTLGCARCHDHKFDPVSQEDYYALAGIFRSTEIVQGTRNGCVNVASWVVLPLPLPGEKGVETKKKVERLELAMKLTVEKQFMNKAGGKMALGKLPLAGVIYDEADAELRGNWKESTLSSNRFGAQYVHNDQKEKGGKTAIFRGSLPESGVYEVRLAYNANENRASNVPITVEARDGIYKRTLNEREQPEIGGLFQPVGRFAFEKGGRVNVIIETTGTDGYVIVDAVQFIPVEDIEREKQAIAAVDEDAIDPLFRMNEGELKKALTELIVDLKDEEVVMAPRDARDAGDIHLRIRGEVGQQGEIVRRNFPKVLSEGTPPQIAEGTSGRLELADWLINEDNALLDRVIVNRVWHYLFGQGIVASVDNFGRLGSGPTHPELLDYLAGRFRESGGSIKSLVREIALSRAYQLSADASPALLAEDPENALFGRHNRRRLTAEEIRDSVLFLSNSLDRTPAGATANQYGEDLDNPLSFAKETVRTVYLPVARNNLVAEMAAFDAANPDLVTGSRTNTTVPTQALYLLNSDFFQSRAASLGKTAIEPGSKAGDEIDLLYQRILLRSPSPAEKERALSFVTDLSQGSEDTAALKEACGHLAHVLLASTEFLYLD